MPHATQNNKSCYKAHVVLTYTFNPMCFIFLELIRYKIKYKEVLSLLLPNVGTVLKTNLSYYIVVSHRCRDATILCQYGLSDVLYISYI